MKNAGTKALLYFAFLWIFLLAMSGCAHESLRIPCRHNWGPLQQAVPASFFADGSIAHYQCVDCAMRFDAHGTEVDTVTVPKLSADLSLCVNGVPTSLTLAQQDAACIRWTLEDLIVEKGDVITIQDARNQEYGYTVAPGGNLDENGKIKQSTKTSTVSLMATPNGLTLSIQNNAYPGMVVEVNGEQYPMHTVPCHDTDGDTYMYGYAQFRTGDRLTIIDNVRDITYGYDDLAEDLAWNIYDFHRGENGEFVIDRDARYTVEFSKNGNQQIYITKLFSPTAASGYQLHLEGQQQKTVPMEDTRLTPDSVLFDMFAWYAAEENTINGADITGYIAENGLHTHSAALFLEAGTLFYIENTAVSENITGDHLTEVSGTRDCFQVNGQLIEITQSGTYHIRYMPSHGSISLQQLSTGGLTDTAKEFDRKIASLPSKLELYHQDEIKTLYTQYLRLPTAIRSLLRTSAKLEAMYHNVLELENTPSRVIYYMNTENTVHVYRSREELMEAFFTDFYYYIAAHHGTAWLRGNGIKHADDFVKVAKVSPDAIETDFYEIGYLAGKYFLESRSNSTLESQTANGFLGFCYENGLYQDILPFLIRYFAYWRIDEGYATQANCGADMFAEGWAPTVDITKFFYFDETTSPVRTARMYDCFTNTAGVIYGFDPDDPLPDIRLRGYVFEGWYDNPECSGDPVTSFHPGDGQTVLYAKWDIDPDQQDRDAAGLVDVYIYNLDTQRASRNSETVGYVKEMYDALSANAKLLVTNYPVLQKFIDQYLKP